MHLVICHTIHLSIQLPSSAIKIVGIGKSISPPPRLTCMQFQNVKIWSLLASIFVPCGTTPARVSHLVDVSSPHKGQWHLKLTFLGDKSAAGKFKWACWPRARCPIASYYWFLASFHPAVFIVEGRVHLAQVKQLKAKHIAFALITKPCTNCSHNRYGVTYCMTFVYLVGMCT